MVSTNQLLIGGAILGGVVYITILNPGFVPGLISQVQSTIQGFMPQPAAASGSTLNLTTPTAPNPVTPASSLGVPSSAVIQPPLSVLQQGLVTPFKQSIFCDPSFGEYWDPLQGRCVQQLAQAGGRCQPGSVWNSCQCQCVPVGIPQPQCSRRCDQSCPDKQNTVWNWCALGCIGRSASYNLPNCPPLS